MEDDKIVELYWDRNADAITESEKKYGAYCFSIAQNILYNAEDSEECVNDTWLRAWNSMPPHKPEMLQAFLAKITRNLSIDRFHSRTTRKRGGGEIALIFDELSECIGGGTETESAFEAKELRLTIARFVRKLPEREGNVMIRRYFFAESAADIAKRYGLSENNVLVILSRTRKKLKQHLKKEGFL